LASDSAVIYADTGETMNSGINVASMSATGIPSATNRMVYFTNTVSNAHHRGDALIVNITATHTIKFTTSSIIPASGKIILTFPGSVSANTASPSATTFSFNGMAASNPTDVKWNGVTCSSVAVAWPSITCTTSGSTAGGTAITVLIGCTTGTTSCTVFAPRLINPTKSATAGSADAWQLLIQTQDNSSIGLDSSKAIIATVESVQVQAIVEPTLTFTIAGLGTATNYNATVSQCGSETSNSGIGSTATFVNLGDLGKGQINDAAQTLTVVTNAANGYAITSTSSGHFINPGNGFFISDANVGNPSGNNSLSANDTPIPAVMAAGTPAFGISPCGADVPTSTPNWGGTGQTVAGGARFSNPWNTGTNGFYATIASYTGGTVNGDATHGTTLVRYAATVAGTTPPGAYSTVLTYVATPTF